MVRRGFSSFVASIGMVGSLALLAVLAFAGMAFAATAALAEETHVFAGSFGSEGEGAGQLKDPSGVAVNNTTGDVYVADKATGVQADGHYAQWRCPPAAVAIETVRPIGALGCVVGRHRSRAVGIRAPPSI
jgi:hypothetical protein